MSVIKSLVSLLSLRLSALAFQRLKIWSYKCNPTCSNPTHRLARALGDTLSCAFFSFKSKSDINAAKAVKLETIRKARSSTLRTRNTEMPTATIEFKCIRINLKRISSFEPDESYIGSLIEFYLKIGDERLRDLKVEVRQLNGTDFQSQPMEVGNVIGYNGHWNYEEFRELCGRYYRDVIESSGMGLSIRRGERNLIERIAIRLYRREEMNLP